MCIIFHSHRHTVKLVFVCFNAEGLIPLYDYYYTLNKQEGM